ncbi:MAG TPA: DEAD/DEAH box helicase [Streptosporangiaceae bacterium]|nr:DEAD/DEAH box helicase [Streptosporangiaceae bacterium]
MAWVTPCDAWSVPPEKSNASPRWRRRRAIALVAGGPLMEAEALTTHTSTLPDEPQAAKPEAAAELEAPQGREKTFRDFGIAEPICAALEADGITTAFPIQALTLPIALDGYDVIGQARTGTGKTLAFGIPLVQRLMGSPADRPAAPRALVVVPTRELAIQVADDVRLAGSRSGTKVVTLYGGRAYEPQIEALATVDIVVGTPGRLLDLSRQGHLDLSQAQALVLDEADKMLDLGFLPDVEKILRLTPQHRQTMLFSATMPGEVVTLARRHLSRPIHIRAEQHDEPAHVPTTRQHVFRAHQMDKIEVLARVLQAEGRGLTMVFCRTKRNCDQVADALTTRGFAAAPVHGDLGQSQRERAMRAFRSGKVDVLVATDVAARGLDVDDVTHVINYECPEDDNAYLHRIGRTGRAGREGVAVTFVDWHDLQRWKLINDTLNLGQPEPAETYSTSDHLFGSLGIPADARGTLPRARRDRLGLEAEDLEDIGETGKARSASGRGGDRDRGARGRGGHDRGGKEHARGRGPKDRASRSPEAMRETGPRVARVRHRTRAGAPAYRGQGEQASAGGQNVSASVLAAKDGRADATWPGADAAGGSGPGRSGPGGSARGAAGQGAAPHSSGPRESGAGDGAVDEATVSAGRPRRRRRSPRGSGRGTGEAATASRQDS